MGELNQSTVPVPTVGRFLFSIALELLTNRKVEDLAKNRQPTDLTEPLQLLSDTKKLVDGVADMMGGGSGGAAH